MPCLQRRRSARPKPEPCRLQRLREFEPAFFMTQPGQGRPGQGIEAFAAGFAAVPPQAIGAPALDRVSSAALRTTPLRREAILDCRCHLCARLPPVQDLLHLLTLASPSNYPSLTATRE